MSEGVGLRRAGRGRLLMSRLASALAFMSRSTSAYTLVVSSETWPSQARMVLMSTPARSRCTAVVCRAVWGLTRFVARLGMEAEADFP